MYGQQESLRSWEFHRLSRNSFSFMETKDSLPCSKGYTNHTRHMRQMNSFHTIPFQIHFNILSLSAQRYLKSSHSYRFLWRKLFMTFFSRVFYISNPSHPYSILCWLEIMKLPILEFFAESCCFLPFKS